MLNVDVVITVRQNNQQSWSTFFNLETRRTLHISVWHRQVMETSHFRGWYRIHFSNSGLVSTCWHCWRQWRSSEDGLFDNEVLIPFVVNNKSDKRKFFSYKSRKLIEKCSKNCLSKLPRLHTALQNLMFPNESFCIIFWELVCELDRCKSIAKRYKLEINIIYITFFWQDKFIAFSAIIFAVATYHERRFSTNQNFSFGITWWWRANRQLHTVARQQINRQCLSRVWGHEESIIGTACRHKMTFLFVCWRFLLVSVISSRRIDVETRDNCHTFVR